MSRIDERFIGQILQAVDGLVEHVGQLVRRDSDRSQQVWPSDIADEQGVAGQHRVRLGVTHLQIEGKDRDSLRRVPWGFHDLQADVAELDDIPVLDRVEVVLGLGLSTEINVGTNFVAKLDVPREKVRMEVREEDVLNLPAVGFRVVNVLLDVSLWVHDCRHAGAFIGDHVRRVGQTAEIILLEFHRLCSFGFGPHQDVKTQRQVACQVGRVPDAF